MAKMNILKVVTVPGYKHPDGTLQEFTFGPYTVEVGEGGLSEQEALAILPDTMVIDKVRDLIPNLKAIREIAWTKCGLDSNGNTRYCSQLTTEGQSKGSF